MRLSIQNDNGTRETIIKIPDDSRCSEVVDCLRDLLIAYGFHPENVDSAMPNIP